MEGGEGHESFLWENQSWALSNSDNSGGSEDKSRKKRPDSSSNSPTAVETTEPVPSGKKRSRSEGGADKKGKGSGEVKDGKGGSGGGESDHEVHIWTERERRKKMRNMFSNLHALIPHLPPKADKSTIVDEAVNYIKTLEEDLQKLEKKKVERLQGAMCLTYDPSIITPQRLNYEVSREAFLAQHQGRLSTNMADITPTNNSNPLSGSRFPAIFQTWTSQNVILNVCGNEAQISVCSIKKPGLFTTICHVLEKHKMEVVSAHVSSDSNRSMFMIQARYANHGAPDQFPEAFPMEELYKQAALEIMFWVSS